MSVMSQYQVVYQGIHTICEFELNFTPNLFFFRSVQTFIYFLHLLLKILNSFKNYLKYKTIYI